MDILIHEIMIRSITNTFVFKYKYMYMHVVLKHLRLRSFATNIYDLIQFILFKPYKINFHNPKTHPIFYQIQLQNSD